MTPGTVTLEEKGSGRGARNAAAFLYSLSDTV